MSTVYPRNQKFDKSEKTILKTHSKHTQNTLKTVGLWKKNLHKTSFCLISIPVLIELKLLSKCYDYYFTVYPRIKKFDKSQKKTPETLKTHTTDFVTFETDMNESEL